MMNRTLLFTLLILTLLLAACGGSSGSDSPSGEPAYPGPNTVVDSGYVPWYPGPGQPGAPAAGAIMTSGYEPRSFDESLTRDQVYLELATSQLVIMESMPIQIMAVVAGNLPDPCHVLRVKVTAADASGRINLEAYSLADTSAACSTELEPFTATIPLGTYSGGHFSVYVNGELLGEFDS
jgi:hypothetical protein